MNVADFQHPSDKRAVDAVMAVPCLNQLLDFISKNSIERIYAFMNDSSRLKITAEISPKIIGMLEDAAQMYGLSTIPKVYLERNYTYLIDLNGMSDPHIVLPTRCCGLYCRHKPRAFRQTTGPSNSWKAF